VEVVERHAFGVDDHLAEVGRVHDFDDRDRRRAAAHEVAERIEAALRRESDVEDVQTHLEPLEEPFGTTVADDDVATERIAALVEERTGAPPRRLKLLTTELGLVVFVDVVASPEATLEAAHDMARTLEGEIRRSRPEGSARIVDVVVHTEP
jgi:divalent metal cation (Fe/Co/Zn/Cd) transporter